MSFNTSCASDRRVAAECNTRRIPAEYALDDLTYWMVMLKTIEFNVG